MYARIYVREEVASKRGRGVGVLVKYNSATPTRYTVQGKIGMSSLTREEITSQTD